MENDIEVVDFFSNKKFPLTLLIDKRRHNTTPKQVEIAAAMVYDEIKAGLKIDDQDIPRYVWEKAKNIKGDEYRQARIEALDLSEELERLRISIDAKRITWLRLLFISGWGFMLIYIVLQLLELGLTHEIF